MDASSLPPELEEEFVALQEALAEEERENSDLVRRREELSGNIQSQKREMETLEESLSMLEVKVWRLELTDCYKSIVVVVCEGGGGG